LPDSPLTAYFLSTEQKVVAVERMRWEQSGIENKTIKMEQFKEVFTDPKTWFYVLATFLCNFTNGAVTGFGSIIVKSFGVCFFSLITLLLFIFYNQLSQILNRINCPNLSLSFPLYALSSSSASPASGPSSFSS
jgi:hypothetical protein